MNVEIKKEWLTIPINCTCEVMLALHPLKLCGKATTAAYPTMGGGWMSLCEFHARKHLPDGAYTTDELIKNGARWT